MTSADAQDPNLRAEIEELRAQLAEAQETLRAIQSGEVDALVVSGPEGPSVYTLKGEEHAYRLLVESVNEGALTLTLDGTVMYANSAFARMIGVSLEKIIAASIDRFVIDRDRTTLETLLREGSSYPSRRELGLQRAHEGEPLPAYISVSPMTLDETKVLSVVVTDLTEAKRTEHELAQYREQLEELVRERTEELEAANAELRTATEEIQAANDQLLVEIEARETSERALADRERYFRAVYESTQDAIVVVDDEGRIASANPAVREILGLSHSELIGHRIDEFIAPDVDFGRVWQELLRVGFFSGELKLTTPGGTERTVENHATANMLPGRHLAVMHDVTGEVALRDQLRRQVGLLQRALLPPAPKSIAGYAVASAYIPAYSGQQIGGDFYDLFTTEDGEIGLMIGDVSGKGIEAAALAAVTRSTVRAFTYDLSAAGPALRHANSLLAAQQFGAYQFVTSFVAVVDPDTGNVRYSSAGHPPALLRRASGDIILLDIGGAPLGVMEVVEYEEMQTRLDPGDKLIIYTDGISEAHTGSILFGTEGIERVLDEHGDEPPDVLVDSILTAARDFAEGRLRDDTAIVIVERRD